MLFEPTAFFSLWYWLFLAVFWTLLTRGAHGVSEVQMLRAARDLQAREEGGPDRGDLDLADTLARRAILRDAAAVGRSAHVAAAIAGFLFAALAVKAFLGSDELALGLLLVLGPGAICMGLQLAETTRLAPRLAQMTQADLLGVLLRRRGLNRVSSLASAALAIGVLGLVNMHRLALFGGW